MVLRTLQLQKSIVALASAGLCLTLDLFELENKRLGWRLSPELHVVAQKRISMVEYASGGWTSSPIVLQGDTCTVETINALITETGCAVAMLPYADFK